MTIEQLSDQLMNGGEADRVAAAQTLAAMGAEAVPAAVALVHCVGGEGGLGEWCVAALEEIGAPRRGDIGHLASVLESSLAKGKPDSVYWAATLLGRAGPDAADAVSILATVARGAPKTAGGALEQPGVERAVWALGKIGPAAKPALPMLEQLIHSPAPRLVRLAEQAIKAIR